MKELKDAEFGIIELRSSLNARHIRARVLPNGRLGISYPKSTPIFLIKRFIGSSRPDLAKLIEKSSPTTIYKEGDLIGKSHRIFIKQTQLAEPYVKTDGLQVFVFLPENCKIINHDVQILIRQEAIKLLRKQAKAYLPKRLKYIADEFGFNYEKVRFSHASSRWGSCSSTGTISLNIALMKLPHELIDYVLIHELSHTRQMNHSEKFWQLVASIDPHYKLHQQLIKKETPTI